MFSKSEAKQLERYFTNQGTNVQILASFARGVKLVMRKFMAGLTTPKLLWEHGVEDAVLSAASPTDEIDSTGVSQQDWLSMQDIYAKFNLFMNTDLDTLNNLAETDGAGNLVLDENSEVQYPMRTYAPSDLDFTAVEGGEDKGAETPESVIFS